MSASAPRILLLSAVSTRINPYLGLLHAGLAAAGAAVRLAARLDPADLDPERGPQVIHIHWLERLDLPPAILPARSGLLVRLIRRIGASAPVYAVRRGLRLRRLFARLAAFQRAGGCVAYTVHNLDAHEAVGWADRRGLHDILVRADVLHVHDISTADALAARTGRRTGVTVVPHGHYLSAYPNTIDRPTARQRLGLAADAFIYLSLGLVRPYKGQEELIAAFRQLQGDTVRLIVAGRPASPTYAAHLQALAQADARIRLDFRFVPPDEIQIFLNAADVCVLPYRQITTSGAALLALSFGAPLVAPAIGAFPNLIGERRGVLYNPAAPQALLRALQEVRDTDWAGARAENLAWVAQFDWEEIGRRLLAAYAASKRSV